jgi:hypothetical protein
MNRDGIKTAAIQRGFYVNEDLSETAEAANTPDIILGLMPDGADTSNGRSTPLKLGTVKVRDGMRLRNQIPLTVDYATGFIAPRAASDAGHLAETFGGEAPI